MLTDQGVKDCDKVKIRGLLSVHMLESESCVLTDHLPQALREGEVSINTLSEREAGHYGP